MVGARLDGRELLEILGLGKAFYDMLLYHTFIGTYPIPGHTQTARERWKESWHFEALLADISYY